MKLSPRTPPRAFKVGMPGREITLSHVADLALEPDEQVTLVTESGTEFDVVRKDWGYYATPSLDGRLPAHGLRPALVRSGARRYLLLCEAGLEARFLAYLDRQGMEIVAWLDVEEVVPATRKEGE